MHGGGPTDAPQADGDSLAGAGWCVPCYRADGQLTLAADPSGSVCRLHAYDAAHGQLWDDSGAPESGTPSRSGQRPAQTALYTAQSAAIGTVADRPGGRDGRGTVALGAAAPPHGQTASGARPGGAARGPGRTRRDAVERARRRAAAKVRGRRRAAARVTDGRYRPHPGVDNMLPVGRCRDQTAARAWVHQLVAAGRFHTQKTANWTAVLTRLVCAMDWTTGLVTATTHAQLAAAAGCSERTVSRVIAWAIEHGLLVVAEKAASATFLGTQNGRTQTYAVYRPHTLPPPPENGDQDDDRDDDRDPQDGPHPDPDHRQDHTPTRRSDELGDLPHSWDLQYPSHAPGDQHDRAARGLPRLDRRGPADPDLSGADPRPSERLVRSGPVPKPRQPWPLYVIPSDARDRERALDRILEQVGIAPASITRRTRWKLRGVLRRWWDTELAPAAVLHALGHHPDQPDQQRSTLTSGVRDLAAVIAARLRPWTGRLDEIPHRLAGHHPAPATPPTAEPNTEAAADASREPVAPTLESVPLAEAAPPAVAPTAAAPADPDLGSPTSSSATHRARLRAGLRAELRYRRELRGGRGTHPDARRPGT